MVAVERSLLPSVEAAVQVYSGGETAVQLYTSGENSETLTRFRNEIGKQALPDFFRLRFKMEEWKLCGRNNFVDCYTRCAGSECGTLFSD